MLNVQINEKNRNKCFQLSSLLIFIIGLYISSKVETENVKEHINYRNIVNQLEASYEKTGNFLTVNIHIDDIESLLKEIDKFEEYCYELNNTSQPNVTFQKIREEIVDCIKDGGGGQELESLVTSSIHTLLDTEEYIQQFYIDNYKRTNYESIKETPKRLGKDLEEINIVYDYDFPLLYKVEQRLQGIDRKRALSGIFYKICKGEGGIEQHEQMLSFLHETSIHNPLIQPMYEDQTSVFDPLVILELGEMRCGQVARLACDFFDAVDYKTRLVQLGGHVIAEIWYDNGWHYFDADLFSTGETAYLDGKIPSVEELSHFPELLDSLNSSYFESAICSTGGQNLYPSGPYFNLNNYQGGEPLYYIKNASDRECLEKDYGWSHYETVKDEDRVLYDVEIAYEPSIPIIKEIIYNKDENKLLLKWKGSMDENNDLLGYSIMIGSKSRNYDYYEFFGEERTKEYWNGPYKEEMYEYVGKLPLSDLGEYKTDDTEIEIDIKKEWKEIYISIMPFDLHGKEAGRSVFKVSNELKIII